MVRKRERISQREMMAIRAPRGQALAIAVADVDLKQGLVTIEHLKTRIKLACPSVECRIG